jgi:hypothetical protein
VVVASELWRPRAQQVLDLLHWPRGTDHAAAVVADAVAMRPQC